MCSLNDAWDARGLQCRGTRPCDVSKYGRQRRASDLQKQCIFCISGERATLLFQILGANLLVKS